MKQGIQFMRKQPGMESLIVLAFLHDDAGIPDHQVPGGFRERTCFTADRRPSRCC